MAGRAAARESPRSEKPRQESIERPRDEAAPPPRTPAGALLGALPLLAACPAEVLDAIAERAERRVLEAQAEVALGDGEPLVVVLSGTVQLHIGSWPHGTLRPGGAVNCPGALGLPTSPAAPPPRRPAPAAGGRPSARSPAAVAQRTSSAEAPPKDKRAAKPPLDQAFSDDASVIASLCPHGTSQRADVRRTRQAGELPLSVTAGPAGASVLLVPRQLLDELLEGEAGPLIARSRSRLVAAWECVLRHALFPGVPAEVAWALAEAAERYGVPAGRQLVAEGEVGELAESLLIIEEGRAVVERLMPGQGQAAYVEEVRPLEAGAVVGDACFVGARVPRAATLRAETDVRVLRIPPHGFLQVLSRFPGLVKCIQPRLRETASLLEPSLPTHTDVLGTLKLFKHCAISFVRALASAAERHIFYCGDTIQQEGCAAGMLHVVEFGACRAEKAGEAGLLGVASCFGEQVLMSQPLCAEVTVRVATPLALLMAIPRGALQGIVARYPEEQRRVREAAQHLQLEPQSGHDVGNLPVFRTCGQKFTEEIAGAVELRYYMPGQNITVEGAVDTASMFLIKGGRAEVVVMGNRLKELSAGDIFGEFAMLGLVRRRTASVRAVTLCSMIEIPRERFLSALERFPQERGHFEQLTTLHEVKATSHSWSIFAGLPAGLLYLVNLHAERLVVHPTSGGGSTHRLRPDAAVLVLQGVVKQVDSQGNDIALFGEGTCFNEQVLLDLPPLAGELVATTLCEVQVVTKVVYDSILAEFSEYQEQVNRLILHEMAGKAEHKRGFAAGGVGVLGLSALFRALGTETAEPLRASLEECAYGAGEVLFEEDAVGDTIYFLLDGEAEIEARGRRWRRADADARVFGEAVLLGVERCYPVGVRALDTCVVLKLSRRQLERALQDFPAVLEMFNGIRGVRRRGYSLADVMRGTRSKAGKALAAGGSPKSPAEARSRRRMLTESSFFYHASAEFVDKICEDVEDVFFAPGERIVKVGEACRLGLTPCYVLLCGEAVVEDEFSLKVGTLWPGDVFGEAGALGLSARRMASVRAATNGVVHCSRLHPRSIEVAMQSFERESAELTKLYKSRQASIKSWEEARKHFIQTSVAPALGASPVLAPLPPEALQRLMVPLPEQQFHAGEAIAVTGQDAGSMLLLVSGEASVEDRDGVVRGRITAGAVLGEVSVLGLLAVRTSTVRASEECKVMRVPARAILDLLEEPEAHAARAAFERLRAARLRQVAEGMPVSLLPSGLMLDPSTVCSRTICLHAECLDVPPGGTWAPLADNSPRGPHVGVLAQGASARLVVGADRTVMPLTLNQLIPEGLLAQHGARVVADSRLRVYRICQTDFLLAVTSSPPVDGPRLAKFLKHFEDAVAEAMAHLRFRLENARGAERVSQLQLSPERVMIRSSTLCDRMLRSGLGGDGSPLPSLQPSGEGGGGRPRSMLYEVSSGLVALKEKPNARSKGLGVLRGGSRFFGVAHTIEDQEWLQVQMDGVPTPLFSPAQSRSCSPQPFSAAPGLPGAAEAWVRQEGTCVPLRQAKKQHRPASQPSGGRRPRGTPSECGRQLSFAAQASEARPSSSRRPAAGAFGARAEPHAWKHSLQPSLHRHASAPRLGSRAPTR